MTLFFEKDSPHGMEEDVVRFKALYRDSVCHQYILHAIEHYAVTLKLDMKHVYQALPRLLSLWFDFVSVQPPKHDDNEQPATIKPEYLGECDHLQRYRPPKISLHLQLTLFTVMMVQNFYLTIRTKQTY